MTVAVVGGGVVGVYAAGAIAERGHAVRLLDARLAGQRTGASFVNAGLITPSHLVPLTEPGVPRQVLASLARRSPPLRISPPRDRATARWLLLALACSTRANVEAGTPVLGRLLVESLERLRADLRRLGREEVIQGYGAVMLAFTEAGLQHTRGLAEAAGEQGIESEVLDVHGVRALDPAVAPEVAGGAWFPGDARVDPSELMRVLEERAAAAGTRLERGRRARALRVERGAVRGVECDDGFEPADAVVLAAGAQSGALLRGTGIDLPLIAGRGYGLTLDLPVEHSPRHAVILVEDYMAISPRRSGLHLTSGMVLGARAERVDAGDVRAMRAALERAFPELGPASVAAPAAAGMRPCSPDGLPYIGPVDGIEGLVLATGHGMLGLALAAVTAARVAVTLDGAPPDDLEPLRPNRFPRSSVRAAGRALFSG